jgi:RNA polymerase sigma factor (sigma-70 family)
LLVGKMKKGTQKDSFESVFKKLATPLTKFVIKRVAGDSEAAEEVLSATMIAGWRGWKSFKHKSSYFTWLCRISLNKISDYYRDQVNKNSRIIIPLIDTITQADEKSLSPEEAMALKELRGSVNDCLDLLSPKKRRLLQFRYWHDLSYAQIAKILGTSERAVEGKLYRAKQDFAKVWGKINQ